MNFRTSGQLTSLSHICSLLENKSMQFGNETLKFVINVNDNTFTWLWWVKPNGGWMSLTFKIRVTNKLNNIYQTEIDIALMLTTPNWC